MWADLKVRRHERYDGGRVTSVEASTKPSGLGEGSGR
jgi:hypothetical protein